MIVSQRNCTTGRSLNSVAFEFEDEEQYVEFRRLSRENYPARAIVRASSHPGNSVPATESNVQLRFPVWKARVSL